MSRREDCAGHKRPRWCVVVLLAGAMGASSAWAQPLATSAAAVPAAPVGSLTDLPADVAALMDSLGETQIGFLQQFLKPVDPDSSLRHMDRFRERINFAVQLNPEVLSASAARNSAQFAIREAQAGLYPQVSGQGFTGKIRNDPSTLMGTPERNYRSSSLGLTVRQLLYDFGATDGSIDASTAREKTQMYKMQLTRGDVALRSVQAYHEVLRAHRQLMLAKSNLEARESILDLVTQRQELGGGTVSDVVRAQSRVADAAASVVAAQQRLGLMESSYKELFGKLPEGNSPADFPLVDLPLDQSLLEDLGRSASNTLKVQMAKAGRDAASADLVSITGKALPSINVEVSRTRRDLNSPGEPGNDQSLALVVRQTLYSGGADTARINQAREKLSQSEEDLQVTLREAERLYAQALLEAKTADGLVRTREKAVELSAQSLRMIREQFAYRRGSLLDLLTAQETLNAAGRDMVDSQIDRVHAKYKLMFAASMINRFFALD